MIVIKSDGPVIGGREIVTTRALAFEDGRKGAAGVPQNRNHACAGSVQQLVIEHPAVFMLREGPRP
jgi:hypothetical protein